MTRSRNLLTAFLVAGSLASRAWSLEIKPVIDLSILGGQYYYNAAENSYNAIASLDVSPYMKFDDHWSLEPLYSGSYHGTQQVQDLIGGGTLFQDSQEHTGSVKLIRSFDDGLKIKAIGSYGFEFLRETPNETWGEGLYDNDRKSTGAEAEWSWAPERFLRLTYDYYAITFPNYNSLESQGDAAGLGREFNAPDVLDTHNNAVTVGTQVGLPGRGWLNASAGYTWSHFGSEHLVDSNDQLVGDVRNDQAELLSLEGTWPVWVQSERRLFASLGYNWTHLYSNQNHYDTGLLVFDPDYYGYVTQSLQSQWTLAVGENPWTVSLNGSLARQHYSNRLVQDADGQFGADVTHVDSASVGIALTYPIAQRFHVIARFDAGWDNSNNQDNAVYRYHYNTQTYLMGFSYAY